MMDSSFNPNAGGNSGAGKINPNANKQPQQPDVQEQKAEQPAAAAQHPELSEQVMEQLAWIAKSGERSVEMARIERLLKSLPGKEKINQLCQQVNECFEEEFHAPCPEDFAALVTANLLIGQPSIHGVGAEE